MRPIRVRDQSYIKSKNIESVLSALEECQPVSRAEIARITDMSPTSITRIVNALLSLGLVSETSAAPGGGRGRRAINLCIRGDGMHTLGVCLEPHRIKLGVMDLGGKLLAAQEMPLSAPPESPEAVARAAKALLDGMPGQWPRLRAVGVCLPGTVDNETGLVGRSDQLGWTRVDVTTPFSQAFSLPAWAENDVKACLLGEKASRGIPDEEDTAYLLIGTGLGVALTSGGQLLRGADNAAGEIHAVPFGAGGLTLRDHLVEHALIERAQAAEPGVKSIDDVIAAYRQKITWAMMLMRDVFDTLRLTLRIIEGIARPHRILLGGSLAPRIVPLLEEGFSEPRVCLGQNYEDACLIGAAILAQRQARHLLISNELEA